MSRWFWLQTMFWLRLDQALRILGMIAIVVAPFVFMSWAMMQLGLHEVLL